MGLIMRELERNKLKMLGKSIFSSLILDFLIENSKTSKENKDRVQSQLFSLFLKKKMDFLSLDLLNSK